LIKEIAGISDFYAELKFVVNNRYIIDINLLHNPI